MSTTVIHVSAAHSSPPAPSEHDIDPHGNRRSGEWRSVEKHHLRLHPVCACCGTDEDLQVHHIEPFHVDPSKELDPDNLITLCRPHHLWVGHLGSWKSWNPKVRRWCAVIAKAVKNRPLLPAGEVHQHIAA